MKSSPSLPESHPALRIGLRLEAAGLSDVGCKRTNNEDSFGYDLDSNIFIVCDGMGGMAAGEVASAVAVEQALKTYCDSCHTSSEPEARLHAAITSANRFVWHLAQSRPELYGMGTTLVAACVHGDQVVIGNVGDSRAYFLRDGACVQITKDHTYVAEQVSAVEQSVSIQQFITRAIGADSMVEPDFFVAEIRTGDIILLATDGLTRYVNADVITHHEQMAQTLEDLCCGLLNVVQAQGADDNLTCVAVRIL